MIIAVGTKLPEANLGRVGEKGPEAIALSSLSKGKKLVIFGLPGAFTSTCSKTHLPSFIRTADAFRAKGVDHIVCFSVNDVYVMKAWDDASGGGAAGIELYADGDASLTKALGLDFSAPAVGFIDRCKRFSAYVVDGEVKILHFETQAGVCDFTAGETLLAEI
ncbi:MAG TPA: peroxiredoxin [Rhodobacteraceae bacterium]|jgi:glutaredoxin/glutathione-dependent peroxiredoxin|nr:peroxiredoxin [Pseudomonadota bacterium]NQW14146.1 peroxiredoxin [Rhodobacter sp.]HBN30768.1 peroxiredoxin [Paracoccaceae bacterium]